jgi:hypothetical protein
MTTREKNVVSLKCIKLLAKKPVLFQRRKLHNEFVLFSIIINLNILKLKDSIGKKHNQISIFFQQRTWMILVL